MSLYERESGRYTFSDRGFVTALSHMEQLIEHQDNLIRKGCDLVSQVLSEDNELQDRMHDISPHVYMNPMEKLIRASTNLQIVDAPERAKMAEFQSYCKQFCTYIEAQHNDQAGGVLGLFRRMLIRRPSVPVLDLRFDLNISSMFSADAANIDSKMVKMATALITDPGDRLRLRSRSEPCLKSVHQDGKRGLHIDTDGFVIALKDGLCAWEVKEGNKSVERARNHYYSKGLFSIFEALSKSHDIDGKTMYSNEYSETLTLNEYRMPERLEYAPGTQVPSVHKNDY